MNIEYICKNCKAFTEQEYCGQGKRKYYGGDDKGLVEVSYLLPDGTEA